MYVTGYWRAHGWVRSHYKAPNSPGVEQLPLEEVEIPRQRSAGELAQEVRDDPLLLRAAPRE
jgi:hypothetical protein